MEKVAVFPATDSELAGPKAKSSRPDQPLQGVLSSES
jgi:hypothetical protein